MSRAVAFIGGIVLLFHPVGALARQAIPLEPKPVTVTATIEAIDKETRKVTLKQAGGSVEIVAPPQVQGFNSLRVGDQVTATYSQAFAVSIRKPGDPAPPSSPITSTVRKDRKPGSETQKQQTITATVQAIDAKAPSLTVKGPQGRVVTIAVPDAKQVQNLKPGDTVDVIYYESLLITVERPKK